MAAFAAAMSVMPERGTEPFWSQTLTRVRALPGVRTASLSVLTPLSGRDTELAVAASGYHARSDEDRGVHVNHVSDDYFRTFGIQLLAGRAFTPQDRSGTVRVALVNEATARAYFAGRSALGETLRFGDSAMYRIVGIVRDAKHMSVREQTPRFAFLPLWQPLNGIGRVTLAIASDLPTPALVRAVMHEIHGIQSSALISDIVGVQDQIDATLVSERLLSTLATAFAALALGLAAIGLYGVLSFLVARRRGPLAGCCLECRRRLPTSI